MEEIRLKTGEQSKKFGKRAFIVTDTIMENLGYVESCIQQLNTKVLPLLHIIR